MSEGLVIHPLSDSERPLWKHFIYESQNGTLFHDLDFLAYHPTSKFTPVPLLFQEKGNLKAVFPGVEQKKGNHKALLSHPGASYGGLVLARGLGAEEIYKLVSDLVTWGKEQGFGRIEMTLPPEICSEDPDHHLEFALILSGFKIARSQLTGAVPLFPPHPRIKNSAMRMVGKARRAGVEVAKSDDFKGFYEILVENRSQHGAKPTHTFEELERLRKLVPEHLVLFEAMLGGKAVAGTLLFLLNERVALNFYLAHLREFQEHRATNLVFYETIQWVKAQGFRYLDMGTSMVGAEPNWSLTDFKERFGARGFLRNTFQLEMS